MQTGGARQVSSREAGTLEKRQHGRKVGALAVSDCRLQRRHHYAQQPPRVGSGSLFAVGTQHAVLSAVATF